MAEIRDILGLLEQLLYSPCHTDRHAARFLLSDVCDDLGIDSLRDRLRATGVSLWIASNELPDLETLLARGSGPDGATLRCLYHFTSEGEATAYLEGRQFDQPHTHAFRSADACRNFLAAIASEIACTTIARFNVPLGEPIDAEWQFADHDITDAIASDERDEL